MIAFTKLLLLFNCADDFCMCVNCNNNNKIIIIRRRFLTRRNTTISHYKGAINILCDLFILRILLNLHDRFCNILTVKVTEKCKMLLQ